MLARVTSLHTLPRRWLSTYASLTDTDVSFFQSVLPPAAVVQDADALAAANTDWMSHFHGSSKLMLRPTSTEQVSSILAYCHERRLAVVPQGGNTGLVGGSVPVGDEVLLSMSSMDSVIDLDATSGIVTCEAGVILQNLDSFAGDHGLTVPLDLGAKGSCQLGGNASTNAGGIRFIRYGSLHGSIVGLEAVTADGTVVDCLSTLRKDNVGYDLKQLFIGSEGTLGVITKLAIQLAQRPSSVNVAFVGVNSFDDVCKVLTEAKTRLGEVLSAVEFMDRDTLSLVLEYIPGTRDPLSDAYPFYVLLETAGSNNDHDTAKLEALLGGTMESGLVLDGVLAQDASQRAALWELRESPAMAFIARGKNGTTWKYDLSLRHEHMYECVEVMRERLAPYDTCETVGYGHLGDCNLHLNMSTTVPMPELDAVIEPFVFEWTAERGGSISAEHGLGQAKNQFIGLGRSPEYVALMRTLKTAMDPHGILNPFKVLPP